MKRRGHNKRTFISYNQHQMAIPLSFEYLIPENHLVRIINDVIERMDLTPLLEEYKGGGRSAYHPRMMTKITAYAYATGIYSSRQIAKACRENVCFMWLSGGNTPDFRTINRFRNSVLKEKLDKIFASVLELVVEKGYVKLENLFVDGTKIRANASKHSYVWRKSNERYQNELKKKVYALLEQIDAVNELENQQYGDKDLEELGEESTVTAEDIEKTVEKLNQRLRENPEDKELKKAVRKLEKNYLPRVKKYEERERKLNGRNSYSKTDEDATFMRMKDDPLGRGGPEPAYNVQVSTENGFALGFSIHQNPTDVWCLIPHLERTKELLGTLPKNIIADAGYGSEENYEYLLKEGLGNYVKHRSFIKSNKKSRFHQDNFRYDSEKDEFICPANRRLIYQETVIRESGNGYKSTTRNYECEDCSNCPYKEDCTRSARRRISVNFRLQELKEQAKVNLSSEEGQRLYAKRGTEVESLFGNLKGNMGFRRFVLRGKRKVLLELGLRLLGLNLRRLHKLEMAPSF